MNSLRKQFHIWTGPVTVRKANKQEHAHACWEHPDMLNMCIPVFIGVIFLAVLRSLGVHWVHSWHGQRFGALCPACQSQCRDCHWHYGQVVSEASLPAQGRQERFTAEPGGNTLSKQQMTFHTLLHFWRWFDQQNCFKRGINSVRRNDMMLHKVPTCSCFFSLHLHIKAPASLYKSTLLIVKLCTVNWTYSCSTTKAVN